MGQSSKLTAGKETELFLIQKISQGGGWGIPNKAVVRVIHERSLGKKEN